MKSKKIYKTTAFFTALFILISITAFTTQKSEGVVIVNVENPSGKYSTGKVRLLYTRKIQRKWEDNSPIKPVAYSHKSALQSGFYSKVLGMTDEEVIRYFKQRQFSNSEPMPTQVDSEIDMINYVANTPGAIGYVSERAAKSAEDKVKVILDF